MVAVKTMILPANMSGQEKRERMAIMEAAISSTMQHPNIVQARARAPRRPVPGGCPSPAAVWESPETT